MCASVPHIPTAAMRSNTSRAPIRGCGTSRTSIRPTSQSTQAFIPASSPQRLAARSNDPRTPPPRPNFSAKVFRQRFPQPLLVPPVAPPIHWSPQRAQPPPPPDSNQKIPSSPRGPPACPLPAHESEFSTGARQPHCSPPSAQSIPPPALRSKSPKASPKPARRKNPQSPSHPAKYKIPARSHPPAVFSAHRPVRPQSKHLAPAARVLPDPPKAAAAFPPVRRDPL